MIMVKYFGKSIVLKRFFNDEQIAVLKEEKYKDITLDVDGNISKAA